MYERLGLPEQRDGQVFRYTAQPAHGHHRHDELEWNLAIRGTCSYLVAKQRYDLRRHSLIWLFPGQEHVLVNPSADCELWVGTVRLSALRRAARVALDARLLEANPAWHLARPLPASASVRLAALSEHLSEVTDHDRYNTGLLHVALECWAAFDAAALEMPARVHPAVDLAAHLLSRRDHPASLNELARRVGLSPGRLSRAFHRDLGVTLVDYRNRVRLERFIAAREPGGTQSILAAALAAGFGSYPQFHRVYVKHFGTTPRAHDKK